MSAIKTTINDAEYTVTSEHSFEAETAIIIDRDGVQVGVGVWSGTQIEDCAADLGDDVYDALDTAIAEGTRGPGRPSSKAAAWSWVEATTEARGGSVPSPSETADALGLDGSTVRKHYKSWVADGRLRKHGPKAGRTYSATARLAIERADDDLEEPADIFEEAAQGDDGVEVERHDVLSATLWTLGDDGEATEGIAAQLDHETRTYSVARVEPEHGEAIEHLGHLTATELRDLVSA